MPISTPDDAAERTQRHLRQCQELAELGMQLARAAAAQALATPPQAYATPEAAPTSAPTTIAADAALLFTRLSRTVRQAILLETRLAADHRAATPRTPAQSPDPRRDYLRQTLHRVAAHHPEGLDFKREAYERIDSELASNRAASAQDLLATIAEALGVVVTEDHLPPHASRHIWPPIIPPPPRATPDPHHARRT